MSDTDSPRESIREHEKLDPETIAEDVKDLFEPKNDQLPPLNPDTPPPDEPDKSS